MQSKNVNGDTDAPDWLKDAPDWLKKIVSKSSMQHHLRGDVFWRFNGRAAASSHHPAYELSYPAFALRTFTLTRDKRVEASPDTFQAAEDEASRKTRVKIERFVRESYPAWCRDKFGACCEKLMKREKLPFEIKFDRKALDEVSTNLKDFGDVGIDELLGDTKELTFRFPHEEDHNDPQAALKNKVHQWLKIVQERCRIVEVNSKLKVTPPPFVLDFDEKTLHNMHHHAKTMRSHDELASELDDKTLDGFCKLITEKAGKPLRVFFPFESNFDDIFQLQAAFFSEYDHYCSSESSDANHVLKISLQQQPPCNSIAESSAARSHLIPKVIRDVLKDLNAAGIRTHSLEFDEFQDNHMAEFFQELMWRSEDGKKKSRFPDDVSDQLADEIRVKLENYMSFRDAAHKPPSEQALDNFQLLSCRCIFQFALRYQAEKTKKPAISPLPASLDALLQEPLSFNAHHAYSDDIDIVPSQHSMQKPESLLHRSLSTDHAQLSSSERWKEPNAAGPYDLNAEMDKLARYLVHVYKAVAHLNDAVGDMRLKQMNVVGCYQNSEAAKRFVELQRVLVEYKDMLFYGASDMARNNDRQKHISLAFQVLERMILDTAYFKDLRTKIETLVTDFNQSVVAQIQQSVSVQRQEEAGTTTKEEESNAAPNDDPGELRSKFNKLCKAVALEQLHFAFDILEATQGAEFGLFVKTRAAAAEARPLSAPRAAAAASAVAAADTRAISAGGAAVEHVPPPASADVVDDDITFLLAEMKDMKLANSSNSRAFAVNLARRDIITLARLEGMDNAEAVELLKSVGMSQWQIDDTIKKFAPKKIPKPSGISTPERAPCDAGDDVFTWLDIKGGALSVALANEKEADHQFVYNRLCTLACAQRVHSINLRLFAKPFSVECTHAFVLFCPDPHVAGMRLRRESSPREDSKLRTPDVVGMCALNQSNLDALGLLGAGQYEC